MLASNFKLVPEHVHVIRAQAWDAARHFSILGRYPSLLALPDRWSSWIPFGTRAALHAMRTEPFDAMFSTFPISSAHCIGRNVHRKTGLPWIADFRDPMASDTYPEEPPLRQRWARIEAATVRESSAVTVTTPGAANFYRNKFTDLSPERFVVIENGFDPVSFAKAQVPVVESTPRADEPLLLLHSGILYPRERDPAPFFRALRTLRDRGVIKPGSVEVRLRASGFDQDYTVLARELGVLDMVKFAPALPYTEALSEMQRASALLLFQAKECNDQIPAKAYEYLYAGRPILGLADPLGDTGKLLERFGVPGVVSLEDEADITRMLEQVLPQIRERRYPIPPREAVMSVSRRAGAEQLAALLDSAVEKVSARNR